ncbi:MAG: alpha/beta fold hydrolase [Chloroflexales bacterium]|nr:alpha/beta fold hydrolase [Chloroflexales bacterium]
MNKQNVFQHATRIEGNNNSSTTLFVLNQAVRLHVTTFGNKANPALFIMHGFPDSSIGMMAVAEALADEYFVIVPDGRGVNNSDAPADVAAYKIELLVSDVIAIADALIPGQQFVLVGHDWGGAVAWATVSLFPAYIVRAVIYAGPHPAVFLDAITHDEAQQRASLYMHALRQPDFETRFMQDNYALPIQVFSEVQLSALQKTALIVAWDRPGRITGALNWYRAADFVVVGGSCTIPIPDGHTPVRLLWGELDAALLSSLALRHLRMMPWIELQVLPGMGHWFPHTHPAQCAELIRHP